MAHPKIISLTKDGEGWFFDKDPHTVLSSLRNGRYTITITRQGQRRSLDQNALMWLWFSCIEAETGTPRQDVHDYYCKRFLRKTIHWNERSEVVVEGSSRLTTERMTTFLSQIQADAATEFGITLPLPEDRMFESFYQMYK